MNYLLNRNGENRSIGSGYLPEISEAYINSLFTPEAIEEAASRIKKERESRQRSIWRPDPIFLF